MSHLLVLLLSTIIACASAPVAASRAGRALEIQAGPSVGPAVYLSTDANICANFSGLTYWIFVHSPADSNLTGVSLDIGGMNSTSPPVVLPGDGVTLGAVDVTGSSYHLEVSWTTRSLLHKAVIGLQFSETPIFGLVEPANVMFTRPTGSTVGGVGMQSLQCCLDCFGCSHSFFADDYALIPIGEPYTFPFEWSWFCWSVGGGPITVTDSEGWVVAWAPTSAGDYPTCGLCFVPRYSGWVEIAIPDHVSSGTTSSLRIAGLGASIVVTLEASSGTPVHTSTWGRIKMLFEGE